MKQIQYFFYLLMFCLLTACGSGDSIGDSDDGGGDDGTTPPPAEIAVNVSIDNNQIDANNPAVITAKVTEDGDAVEGVVVTFSSDLGVFDVESKTALTNSEGIATIGLTAGTTTGAGTVTATIPSGESGNVSYATAGDGIDPGDPDNSDLVLVQMSISSTQVNASNPATVTATVTDLNGPVAGSVLTFTSNLGFLLPTSGTALTDANGQATILINAGDVQGAGTISASTENGETGTISFATAGDGGVIAGKQISVILSSIQITEASPATATVTVTDENGAVAGEVVEFHSSLGDFNPISGTALTNASGVATISLTAGDTQGAALLTARLSSGEFDTIGFETAGDASGVSGKAISLSISNTAVDAANPAILTATVTDAGNPVSGEVVTFTSALGVFSPGSTALTNSAGIATITLTAGAEAGASIVTARLSNGSFNTIGFETAGDQASPISIDVQLVTPGTTDEILAINSTTPGQLVATVTGINSPVIVTFSSDIAELPIPTAITDDNFQAKVDVYAGNTLGAGTVTASLKDGETGELLLVVGATDLKMGSGAPFAEGIAELTLDDISAGGTTVVSVDIVDENGVLYTSPVDVTFTSSCVVAGTATISSPVTSSSGTASSTFLAQGCAGPETINVTANAGGVNLSASASVTVATADAGSIEFVSASPENISLKGIGGAESSTIIFRVLDTNGLAVGNKRVIFDLNTNSGGVSLGVDSATSDVNGLVQTVVNSGTVATPVRVFATLEDDNNIATQSSLLVISTGIPDQDSFSLSASLLNPEAWSIDGVESDVIVRLADSFNNPAPDGTAVSFTAEGASVQPSCLTVDGACSVTWKSQSPRPPNGRVSILAFAVGEESFADFNGNGRLDAGDEVDAFRGDNGFNGKDVEGDDYDLPEAFIDHNEDQIYNPAADNGSWDGVVEGQNEEFYDFVATDDDGNVIGLGIENSYDSADNLYNGSLCNTLDINGNVVAPHDGCSEQKSLHIREEIVIVMSGSSAFFTPVLTNDGHDVIDLPFDNVVNITGENSGGATVYIADLHDQPMPQGTTVSFSTNTGSIVGPSSFIWPNESRNSGRNFSVVIEGEEEPKSGSLVIEVKTPSGLSTTYSGINVVISAP